jgi:hypothetical protein
VGLREGRGPLGPGSSAPCSDGKGPHPYPINIKTQIFIHMGKQEAEADPWQMGPPVEGDGVQETDLGVSHLTPPRAALECEVVALDGL